MKINENVVLLGDLHFGIKNFNKDFFNNQKKFFTKALIPYMVKNNLRIIFQLGDIFDNRNNVDIWTIENVIKLFDILKENKIQVYSITGNHDIYYRDSREITLLNVLERACSNYKNFNNIEVFEFFNNKCAFIPWLTKDDNINAIKDYDALFGHFEISNFKVSHYSTFIGNISENIFKKNNIRKVFSGHFHIKSNTSLVNYIGTPYQMDWGDYKEEKGFYVLNRNLEYNFIINTITTQFIKLKYNEDVGDFLILDGLSKEIIITKENFGDYILLLQNSIIKFFVNKAKSKGYEEYLYLLNANNIEYTFFNNQEMYNLLGVDYINYETIPETKTFLEESIKNNAPHLYNIYSEIVKDINFGKN